MPRPTPLAPPFDGAAFSVGAARAAGISRARTRSGDLTAPFYGVRAPAVWPSGVESLCAAYLARMDRNEAFSHATAARLHGLPVPTRLRGDVLHVVTAAPRRAPRSRGVIGHQVDHRTVSVVIVRGMRMVSAPDAWCQLAPELTVRELVVMGDALVRRKRPISTMDRLRSRVEAHRGRRGYRKLAEALEHVRPGTDSAPETELRLDLIAFGLPEPKVNHPIRNRQGRVFALGDLTYDDYGVIVEYDGEHHRTQDEQYVHDVDRLAALGDLGWVVVRFNKSHVGARRRDKLALVRSTLVERGWSPPA